MKENTPNIQHPEILRYLEMMQFLNESMDDYLYVIDLPSGTIYFSGNISEKFDLPCENGKGCSFKDWSAIVYHRDLPPVLDDLLRVQRGEQQVHDMEYRLIDRDGNRVWISCRGKVRPDRHGNPLMLAGRVSNKVLGEKVDSLTGLLNGRKCVSDLSACLKEKKSGCLLAFDLDNFKDINIKYGRAYGNHILQLVTEALETTVDPEFLLYRLDGDRFAVNLTGRDASYASEVYEKLQLRLADHCTLSAGAVPYEADSYSQGETLYQYAESALDRAKKQGKNILVFFSQEDYEKRRSTIELQNELRQSIRNGFQGFSLYFQPQVDCKTCRIFGAEALLRYTSPTRGFMNPSAFIPLLEQTEMICPVGEWVLENALALCRIWRETIPDLHISVNVSYVQLRQKNIAETVLSILDRSGLPGSALTLELTESVQLQDFPYFNQIFYRWAQVGIQISIDDFGTGYSSLSYLKNIEINEIKMDRCFVRGIQRSAYNYQLLSNSIELARSSHIRVCCEGVETEEELLTLRNAMPDTLQGYLFAKPCSREQFEGAYLTPSTDAYIKRQESESRYCSLKAQTDRDRYTALIETEELSSIVENMDEMVYVSDAETFELYFLNSAGRRLTGIYDYKGRTCYEVLYGLACPCEHCENKCLSKYQFHVRESENPYLKRHFILKGKLIPWQSKIARLTIAIDITEKELVSQSIQKKLEFEKTIVACSRILVEDGDTRHAISKALEYIARFYNGERAYIFEPVENEVYWNNTYEWCAPGVLSMQEQLQAVPALLMRRWLVAFRQNASVVIHDMNDIRESSPDEWRTLEAQGITCLVAVPIFLRGKIIGFVGCDNPDAHSADDGLLRAMACFLADRLSKFSQEKNVSRLLCSTENEILTSTRLGLWVIRLHQNPEENELFPNYAMRQVLEISEEADPVECFRHWHSRISEGYYHYVNSGVENMLQSEHPVQLEYTWIHPHMGEVVVRCLGVRIADSDGMACLQGYHRIISDVERPRFLTDTNERVIFEYHERRKRIYFHSGQELLEPQSDRVEGFPECWIASQIVHPDFADLFRSLFTCVQDKEETKGQEVLLRNRYGSYEWFKIRTRHLGREREDLHTIIVLLDPASQERLMELEHMKKNDFYEAMLSETIAYAEIDAATGKVQSAGGLWKVYEEECRQWGDNFPRVISRYIEQTVAPEDVEACRSHFSHSAMEKMCLTGTPTQEFYFRRFIDGSLHWVKLVAHVFQERFSKSTYALLYLKDVDTEKRRELARESAANTDPLTNVYNRRMFEQQVCRFMQGSGIPRFGAMVLFDIDNFKSINDRYGHIEGDTSLRHLAQTLQSCFRRRDIIGRLGGDEFLVFVKDSTSREALEPKLQTLLLKLQDTGSISITCSAGVSFARGEDFSYQACLDEADRALYRSKKLGKNRVCFYEDMDARDRAPL